MNSQEDRPLSQIVNPARAMNQSATTECENDQGSQRDRRLVRQIRDDPDLRQAISRELFFEHFARIERTIQRRLCLHGLSPETDSNEYNSVFEAVHERVYAAQSLLKAVKNFDPEKGRLETWLLGRVVFVIRDWLKSARHVRSWQWPNKSAQLADESDPPSVEDEPSVLEEALRKMSAPQRAGTVLRLVLVRDLGDDDFLTISQVAGRNLEAVHEQINALVQQCSGDELGIRENKLLTELSCWQSRRSHRQRLYDWYRKALLEYGESDGELTALQERGDKRTQESIRLEYRTFPATGIKNRATFRMREQFELCCHDLSVCDRRLRALEQEYKKARMVPLLSYENIADVLCSTVAKVTAYLHRARIHLEEEQNRRNAKE